jgi:V-type H+-transporting ATPase subunit C
VRDFVYLEEEILRERKELETTDTTEKELWVGVSWTADTEFLQLFFHQAELLQLSRTNFSESFQILVHLKVVRLFVESVLLYGLPAVYTGVAIKAYLSLLLKYDAPSNHIPSRKQNPQRRFQC